MSTVLLTGATGLLGRFLLRDLLLARQSVAVLTRRTRASVPARHRIDAALRFFESQLGRTLPRPRVIEGNLETPGLEISPDDQQWIARHCSAILHCAASLQFRSEPDDPEPYATNVEGTRRVLELATRSGIRDFHHVSTAYVCGNRSGVIRESEFETNVDFRNDYERSKFLSEKLIREASGLASVTIYRPSIVVGDFTSGYTSTFHGFYLPLQLAHALVKAGVVQPSHTYRQMLQLRGDECKNLVPVDWVSAAMVHIFCSAACHGRTFHLTNPRPVTTGMIESAISAAIVQSVPIRSKRDEQVLSPTQQEQFRQQMAVYAAYFANDPQFDDSNTVWAAPDLPCPLLDQAALMRLAEFAIAANFGWPRRPPPSPELDVESYLQALPPTPSPIKDGKILRFEISGSCGGQWWISFDRETFCLVDSQSADFDAYCNVHTMRGMLAGMQSVEEALGTGRLALRATNGEMPLGVHLMQVLVNRLRKLK